jgi:DNA-binding GntR family transcriptional regulator
MDRTIHVISPGGMPRARAGQTQAGYVQIAEALAVRIRSGELPVGSQIPSERALAQDLHVSRATAREAIELLTDRGLVARRQGAGTFVIRPTVTLTANAWALTSYEIQSQGISSETRVLESRVSPANVSVAATLEIPIGSPVVEVLRVRFGGGLPLGIDHCYHPMALFPGLEAMDLAREHEELVAEGYDFVPWQAQRTLEPRLAGTREVEEIGCQAGEPVMFIRWVGWDEQGRRWGCGEDTYRGSLVTFVTTAPADRAT